MVLSSIDMWVLKDDYQTCMTQNSFLMVFDLLDFDVILAQDERSHRTIRSKIRFDLIGGLGQIEENNWILSLPVYQSIYTAVTIMQLVTNFRIHKI